MLLWFLSSARTSNAFHVYLTFIFSLHKCNTYVDLCYCYNTAYGSTWCPFTPKRSIIRLKFVIIDELKLVNI